ncbi:MAG TPA: amidohydrolase family protein [Acidimicrobiales bacterium]|nr:amidohydrolase family protein [Acidimicrobiales bacterium]
MPYASGRVYYDADSHVMEPSDWIAEFADPHLRPRLKPLIPGRFDTAAARRAAQKRGSDPDLMAKLEDGLMANKGYEALGAWDPAERSRALDLLGFERQLVFTTAGLFPVLVDDDLDLYYGAVRALNRAMAAFCGEDPRLMAVAYVPLVDPQRAAQETVYALELGCAAVMVPTGAPPEYSPTHPAYDGVWGPLAEAGAPFTVHIGGGGVLLPPAFRNNGRPVPPDFTGGGENIRSKDFVGQHRYPEMFLSMLVLDGLFDRFPTLKGASIEQGAEWLVTLLRRLDQAQDAFARNEPDLEALKLRASDYVRRHLRFAPFPFEDVAG